MSIPITDLGAILAKLDERDRNTLLTFVNEVTVVLTWLLKSMMR